MMTFAKMGLPHPLLRSLEKIGFAEPTPIQAKAIPVALEGRDILGSAQTGTGKTGAFAIPMLAKLMTEKQGSALILTPTRELAMQVIDNVKKMVGDFPQLKTALLIGGDSMYKQLQQLKARPRIIVGTPGRINDHLERGTVRFNDTHFLVLDETDRMLDMGFGVQIDAILEHMPRQRQTLLFSATIPQHIAKLADKYMKRPERIAVGSAHTPVERIRTEIVQTNTAAKYTELLAQLTIRQGSVIVFVKTKHGADKLAKKLSGENHTAEAIHGDLNQGKRTRVIQAFRDKKNRILVATDVAARGLDIPHIEHVINYDLPQQPEDYIHRLGRTARAGAEGSAVCFVTSEDRSKWGAIQKLINPNEKGVKLDFAEGKKKKKKESSADHKPRGTRNFAKRKAEEKRQPDNDDWGNDTDRSIHHDRNDRGARSERMFREDRPQKFGRSERFERSDRSSRDRADRTDDRSSRSGRFDREDRAERGDRKTYRDYKPHGDAARRDHKPKRDDSRYEDRKPRRTDEREFGDGALRRSAKNVTTEGRKFGGKGFQDKKQKSRRNAEKHATPTGGKKFSGPKGKPEAKGKKFVRKRA